MAAKNQIIELYNSKFLIMKTFTTLALLFSFLFLGTTIAPSNNEPVAFKYQGKLFDDQGQPIQGPVDIQASIIAAIDAEGNGDTIYQEEHLTVELNQGLFSLKIGRGEINEDYFPSLSDIHWEEGCFWLQIEVKLPGEAAYSFMHRSELLFVPFAMYAQNSSDDEDWVKEGNSLYFQGEENTGRVAIGKTNPSGNFEVFGQTNFFRRANTSALLNISNTGVGGDLWISSYNGGDRNWIVNMFDESHNGRFGIYSDLSNEFFLTIDHTGTTSLKCLQIFGGCDLAENFNIVEKAEAPKPAPGLLVSIDPDNPGELMVTTEAYDKKLAGAVSGANGINTGTVLKQEGTVGDGDFPVALAGRIYIKADASFGAIQPGDMLTSSSVAGHAMKVTDYDRAHGAVIGKAMTALEEGQGYVLVLVNL